LVKLLVILIVLLFIYSKLIPARCIMDLGSEYYYLVEVQGGPKNTPTVNLLYRGIGSKFCYQIHSIVWQLNYTQPFQIALIYHFKPQSYLILNSECPVFKLNRLQAGYLYFLQ
jgi:hypothetical protein